MPRCICSLSQRQLPCLTAAQNQRRRLGSARLAGEVLLKALWNWKIKQLFVADGSRNLAEEVRSSISARAKRHFLVNFYHLFYRKGILGLQFLLYLGAHSRPKKTPEVQARCWCQWMDFPSAPCKWPQSSLLAISGHVCTPEPSELPTVQVLTLQTRWKSVSHRNESFRKKGGHLKLYEANPTRSLVEVIPQKNARLLLLAPQGDVFWKGKNLGLRTSELPHK